MADWTFSKLTSSSVIDVDPNILFKPQSTAPFTLETTNGTINVPNLIGLQVSINKNTTLGIPPRRPSLGQVFPRGVYNK